VAAEALKHTRALTVLVRRRLLEDPGAKIACTDEGRIDIGNADLDQVRYQTPRAGGGTVRQHRPGIYRALHLRRRFARCQLWAEPDIAQNQVVNAAPLTVL
jgi:hypothetical protein